MQDENILQDIQTIDEMVHIFNLSDQKEVDALYKLLKRQGQYRFRSWVGHSFYQALRKKTTYARHRRYAAFFFKQFEIVAFLTAFFLLGVGAAYKMKENEDKVLQEVLQEVKAAGIEETNKAMAEKKKIVLGMPEEEKEQEVLEEYQQLLAINHDFVGWVKIEGTKIDYPVMQDKENPEFYLSHNFLKEEQKSGAVFLAGTAHTFPMDDNVILYGHNMGDGTIFGSLKEYKDETFYQEHAEFEFDTCYEKARYRIVAIVITDISEQEDFCYYEFSHYDEDEFQKCKEFIQKNQLYETGDGIEYGDKLVMLSTCEGSAKTSRLIVIGRKIRDS